MEGLLEHQGYKKIRPIERRIKQQGGDRSQDEVQVTVETEVDKRVLTEALQEEEDDEKQTTNGKKCPDVDRVLPFTLSLRNCQ